MVGTTSFFANSSTPTFTPFTPITELFRSTPEQLDTATIDGTGRLSGEDSTINRLKRWQGVIGISREISRAATAASSSSPPPPFGYDPKMAAQFIDLWNQKLDALVSSNRFASVSLFMKASCNHPCQLLLAILAF